MYLDLEPDFVEYDRITLNVAPKFLKDQLQVKGRKLKQLEAKYGQVVKLKQAEPAICALYKIGLGYKRFAQTLFDAPIPREIRGKRELVDEYKAQLAQVAEPLEQKAVEGLELAMNASRDYGVVNDCAKQATAILVKYKPDEYGPSPEVLPRVAQAEVRDVPRGYGILAQIQPAAPAPKAAPVRRAEAALPPLRVSAGRHAARRAARPGATRRSGSSRRSRRPRGRNARRPQRGRRGPPAVTTTRRIVPAILLAGAIGCAGARPRPADAERRGARPAAAAATEAPQGADAVGARAQRLFAEALKAQEDQQKLAVPTDWAHLERKWRAVLDDDEIAGGPLQPRRRPRGAGAPRRRARGVRARARRRSRRSGRPR